MVPSENPNPPKTEPGREAARSTNGGGNGAPPAGAAPGRWSLPDLRLEWPTWALRLIRPRPPGLSILFDRDEFILARLQPGKRGERPGLTHLVAETLPEDSLLPGLMQHNMSSPVDVAARIGRALDRLPERKKLNRISVALPDACVRVTILTLRDIPRSRRQVSEMIRWQIRKRVPFQLEEARLAVQRFPLGDGSERVVVALALDRVLEQYEQVMESLGLQSGLLDISTFNLVSICPEPAADGDVAILNVAGEEFSILILREGIPLFYRSRPLLHDPVRNPDQGLKELHRELITSTTYYQDRLAEGKSGIRAAFLRLGGGGDFFPDEMAEATLGVKAVRVHPGDHVRMAAEREGEMAPLLEQAAPAVGMILGRWET
jgi:type IV pilus assembly protein PilM